MPTTKLLTIGGKPRRKGVPSLPMKKDAGWWVLQVLMFVGIWAFGPFPIIFLFGVTPELASLIAFGVAIAAVAVSIADARSESRDQGQQ